MWYIIIHHHHGSQTKYSKVHISGSTRPKFFKLWQNRETMSTRGWQSLVTIGPHEPLISSLWIKLHLYIKSWPEWMATIFLRICFYLMERHSFMTESKDVIFCLYFLMISKKIASEGIWPQCYIKIFRVILLWRDFSATSTIFDIK